MKEPDMWIMKIRDNDSASTKNYFQELFVKEDCLNQIGYTKDDGNKIETFQERWNRIKIGDLIVVMEGTNKVYGVVEITSNAWDEEGKGGADWFFHRRKAKCIKYFEKPIEAKNSTNRDTIIEYSGIGAVGICDEIWALIKEDYFLQKKIESMQKYIDILKANKNLILTGAPGTGKSYLAKKIAQSINPITKEIAEDIFTNIPIGTEILTKTGRASITINTNNKTFVNYSYGKQDNSANANFELNIWDTTIDGFKKHNPNDDSYLTAIQDHIKEEFSQNPQKYVSSKIEFVQFHPSYDYTDFVEGLRPTKPDANGNIGFELKNGTFKDFCKKAKNNPNNTYVFIIDEINRAEISKVFGELFFAIDPGYRGEKGKVKTQYSNIQTDETCFIDKDDDYFYIPENVYIIGTMNDIDRSVESFDFAMRRRFAWLEVKAEDRKSMWDGEIDQWKDEAGKKMAAINAIINDTEGLGSAYHIGPAYFLKLKDYKGDFQKLWDYHIGIILSEYLRGMPDAATKLKELENAYNNPK